MTRARIGPGSAAVLVFVMAMQFSVRLASAQQIVNPPTVVVAGPDFASDVLGNPWDMSDVKDLAQYTEEHLGWTITGPTLRTQGVQAFLQNGHFIGTTTSAGNNLINLLFRGSNEIINSNTESVGKFDHKAIPTQRYGKVAVRMNLNTATSGGMLAWWQQAPYFVGGGGNLEFARPQPAGTQIYIADLVSGRFLDSRGVEVQGQFRPVDFPLAMVPWDGVALMRSFTIRPTSAQASVNVDIDWVRLTRRDSVNGPTMPITFTGCANQLYSIEARMLGTDLWTVIHAATAGGAQTTALVNHGVLAPGTWQVRVVCYPGGRTGAANPGTPVQVIVNDPPHLTIADPDAAGGADYATTVKGDPWDMNSLSDIAQTFGVFNPAIVNDGPANAYQGFSPQGFDPALMLLNGPPAAAIDTSRFRHLTFTLTVGFQGEISPARIFWEQMAGGVSSIATSQDIFIHPGRNTYTIDLPTLVEPGGLEPECTDCANLPWNTAPVRFFRLDPHELFTGITFRLGPVTIGATDSVAPGGTFPVRFSFDDADPGASYVARVFLDVDRVATNGMMAPGTLNGVAPNTPLTFNLNTTGVSPGEYFVYVEIQETRVTGVVDTRGVYAGGALRVGTPGPQPPGAPVLTATQITNNPVSVSWTAGPGDPPTSFVLSAGTSPGASNFGTFQMGLQTFASGNVPFGVPIYVRVAAVNAVGTTMSNEINFVAGPVPPGTPTMNPASVAPNRTVTLSWNPPGTGGAPTGYVVIARSPGSSVIIATLGVPGTGHVVPNVPPGTYVVTVVGQNAGGTGPESNAIIVTVP